jgi:hypothetical protein
MENTNQDSTGQGLKFSAPDYVHIHQIMELFAKDENKLDEAKRKILESYTAEEIIRLETKKKLMAILAEDKIKLQEAKRKVLAL